MMGASHRRPGSTGGVLERSNGATISIRAPRPGSFNPSRRPLLMRFSPRLVVFALIASICGLWTLLSSQSSPFPSSLQHSQSTPSSSDPDAGSRAGSPVEQRLPEMVHHDTPFQADQQHPPIRKDQQKPLPHINGQQVPAPLAHVAPAPTAISSIEAAAQPVSTKKPNPFDTYLCAGDEWQVDEDNVYTKPFRFHVYQNMPDHLVKDVVERAAHWWQPDNA